MTNEYEKNREGEIEMKLVHHADADKNGIEPVQTALNFRFGEAQKMCQQVCQHHGGEASRTKPDIEHAQE